MNIVMLIWICREYSDYGARLYPSQRDYLLMQHDGEVVGRDQPRSGGVTEGKLFEIATP